MRRWWGSGSINHQTRGLRAGLCEPAPQPTSPLVHPLATQTQPKSRVLKPVRHSVQRPENDPLLRLHGLVLALALALAVIGVLSPVESLPRATTLLSNIITNRRAFDADADADAVGCFLVCRSNLIHPQQAGKREPNRAGSPTSTADQSGSSLHARQPRTNPTLPPAIM